MQHDAAPSRIAILLGIDMTITTYAKMGERIAEGWGMQDGPDRDIDATIKPLTTEKMTLCVLAAILHRQQTRDEEKKARVLRRIKEEDRKRDDEVGRWIKPWCDRLGNPSPKIYRGILSEMQMRHRDCKIEGKVFTLPDKPILTKRAHGIGKVALRAFNDWMDGKCKTTDDDAGTK